MRAIVLCLLAGAIPCAALDPCQLDYKSWLDPTVVGFTYNKVKVKKGEVKGDEVTVEVTNGNSTTKVTLTAKEWAAAESGCAVRIVPEGIKKKLGISANLARGSAVMATLDFDGGDLNGDGRADHVKVAAPTAALIVELAISNGQLGPRVNYPSGSNPQGADFTGDQRVDIAVANRDGNSVSLFPGNGNGTFAAVVRTAAGPQPSYLAALDSNGDGRCDLIILHQTSATLSTWLGQANGSFQAAGRYLTGVDIGSFVIMQYEDDPR